jgi:hypothetical protein
LVVAGVEELGNPGLRPGRKSKSWRERPAAFEEEARQRRRLSPTQDGTARSSKFRGTGTQHKHSRC